MIADSSRWERVPVRPGDIVVSSPSKAGTTWTQQIVVRLVLGRSKLEQPVSDISPWFEARTHTDDEIAAIIADQPHPSILKTHTPLDGLPDDAGLRIIALARHPLDVALSFRDHNANLDIPSLAARIDAANGLGDVPPREPPPDDDAEYLSWWIRNDVEFSAAGPSSLAEYCNSIATTWARRDDPDVFLLHYDDLGNDPSGAIQELATFLEITPEPGLIDAIVRATSFDALRADADRTVPFASIDSFHDPASFFRVGGSRNAAALLDDQARHDFEAGMATLGPDAERWAVGGRRARDG